MSISTNVKNRLMDAINMAFGVIGIDNGTKAPRTKKGDNKAPAAWEYFVASHLNALARARLEAARKRAILEGVLFDHEQEPRLPGDNGIVYMGEQVLVTVSVNNPTKNTSATKLIAYLKDHGVNPQLLQTAVDQATTTNRPAHVFKVTLASAPE